MVERPACPALSKVFLLGQLAAFPGAEPASVALREDSLSYKTWALMRDFTVCTATQREIVARLGLPEEERKLWNSDGIEPVSRTYHYFDIDVGCRKLTKYLKQFGHAENAQPMRDTSANSDGEEDDSSEVRVQRLNSIGGVLENDQTRGAWDSVSAGTRVRIGLDWTPDGVEPAFSLHLDIRLTNAD